MVYKRVSSRKNGKPWQQYGSHMFWLEFHPLRKLQGAYQRRVRMSLDVEDLNHQQPQKKIARIPTFRFFSKNNSARHSDFNPLPHPQGDRQGLAIVNNHLPATRLGCHIPYISWCLFLEKNKCCLSQPVGFGTWWDWLLLFSAKLQLLAIKHNVWSVLELF